MPRESAWMLRAALLHLVIGFGLGGILLAAKAWPLGLDAPGWLAAHRTVVLLGWMAQTVFAVAYWILPKHPREPIRGRPGPVRAGAVLLNGGIVAAAAAPARVAGAGYLAVGLAGALFIAALAPRIRAFGAGRTL